MNSSAQTAGNSTQPVRLLLIGIDEQIASRCKAVLNGCHLTLNIENASTQTTLTSAFSHQTWDLILISPSLETLSTQQIVALRNEHHIDATLLMLAEEFSDKSTLRGIRDGVHNIVSLQYLEHFQLSIKREIKILKNQRLLDRLQTGGSATQSQHTAANNNKKDLLTGLYSQQFFIAGSQQVFKKSPVDSHTQHSVLFIRLDNVDAISETLGSATTDIIITTIAHCIRSHLPNSCPVARFDNNGFAVLLQKTDLKKSQTTASALCQTVANSKIDVAGTTPSKITCSIGIAITNSSANTAEQLTHQAQMACEGAAVAGGNQPHLFDPNSDEQYGLTKAEQIARQWEKRITLALKESRFKLLYQPIVSLKSNTAENYEILLRMVDENQQEVLPGEFMSFATQAGLMPAIDRWVTRNALIELCERRRNGKDTSFFIKLDHATLSDSHFHTWLSERLRASKLPGDALVFEISERSDVKSPLEVAHFIQQLKVLRCRCGIDHFGDNEASLERMLRLPVDYIKIDRSLIQRINTEPKVQSKIKQLVNAAHEKELHAIAEFVQDAKTLSALWACGIDYIQGYFLQRPDGTMDYDFTEEN